MSPRARVALSALAAVAAYLLIYTYGSPRSAAGFILATYFAIAFSGKGSATR